MNARRLLSVLSAGLFWFSSALPVLAEDAGMSVQPSPAMCCNPTTGICVPATSNTNVQAVTSGQLNLDLESTAQSIQMTGNAPVNLNVAGATQTVNPGDLLTPAQFLAASQVVASGTQSIQLGALGNAVGGSFAMTSALTQQISSMVVPASVTAIHDFGAVAALNLSGNLTNAGNFYALSSNAAVTSASITAANIFNQAGALLTSVLPSGGLPGFTSAVSALDLNLTATNSIINQGMISSSGNLNITAGASIVNQNTMSAALNATLASAIGSIQNSGLIAATAGNINVNSMLAQSLALNNTGGTLQALAGNINASTASLAELGFKPALSITGGDLVAKELNLTSPSGLVSMNVGRVDGMLNISAGEAKVIASTPKLELGALNLTGDPLFWNTDGWVLLNGPYSFPGDNFSVVASEDILWQSTQGYIDVSNNEGDAGSILLIAGANFSNPTTGSGTDDDSTVVTISGASQTGGQIDLSNTTYLKAAATGTGGSAGNGGSITLVAFQGDSGTSGNIFMYQQPSGYFTIDTGTVTTDGSKVNGNVTVIGGAQSNAACNCSIQLGVVNTTGGTANPLSANNGNVIVASATPDFWANPGSQSATAVTLQSSAAAGATSITVSDGSNISGSIYLNALGGNGELLQVSSVDGNVVNLSGSLSYSHNVDEAVYMQSTSLTIDPTNPAGVPASGLSGTDYGGIILPGTLLGGDIALNSIAAGGNITLSSNAGAVTAPNNTNLALVAGGSVIANGTSMTMNLSADNANANALLVIAGAAFTTPPGEPSSISFAISGASTTGGMIDLSGLTSITTANTGSTSGQAGSVTMAAFYGTGAGGVTIPSTSGTITAPSLAITTGTAVNDVDTPAVNGNVIIIAGAPSGDALQLGSISVNGNTVSPVTANNGNVIIASATPTFWGNPGPDGPTEAVTTQGGGTFTDMTLTVTDASNLSANQTVYVNALGGNAEMLEINQVNGEVLTFDTPLQYNHTDGDSIYVSATSLTIDPTNAVGAPTSGLSMTDFGGIVLPGLIQSGNITVGAIAANNTISISTNPSATAGNGTVELNGSMSLSMDPQMKDGFIQPYQAFPSISISGTEVTVANAAVISSQIMSGNDTIANAPNTITILTQVLMNNGTITGGNPTDTPYSNAYINVYSPTGSTQLQLGGSGSFSVPGFSVIGIAATDTSTLLIGPEGLPVPTFNAGIGSVVILNAQGAGGVVELDNNAQVTINGSGGGDGPIVSINTPSLTMQGGSEINATGTSIIAIGSGYTANDLTVTAAGNATISTASGGAIRLRPTNGQDLLITNAGGNSLTFTGATARLATSGGGTTTVTSGAINGTNYTIVTNPAGGILGGEYQPYVGPYFTSLNGNPPEFINFAGYPFHTVVAMLAPVAAEQQVQLLATYTQQYSSSYVIGAAKQVGLNVSAGVFVDLDGSGTNLAPDRTTFDYTWALTQASKYGNVVDLVVGNEDIVAPAGGSDPSASVQTLITAIQTVQTARGTYISPVTGSSFTADDLPVTTRQEIGVLTGDVTDYSAMRTLLNTVDKYIYGNVYPFFYFNTYGGLTPGMSQQAFTTAIQTNMSAQYGAAQTAFIGAQTAATVPVPILPDLRVGETGWATELLNPTDNPGFGYNGSGLPEQSTEWASWYYPAMQDWSFTYQNQITGSQGVVIGGYFGLYNEPWKGIDGGIPGGINGQATTVNNTNPVGPSAVPIAIDTSGATTFPTLTPASIVINPNNSTQEVQNINSINGSTVTVGQLVSQHNQGEVIDAGHPEEPFYGIWAASGVFPLNLDGGTVVQDSYNGYVFTLTGNTLKFTLPVYNSTTMPVVRTPAPSAPAPVNPPASGPTFFVAPVNNNVGTTEQISTKIATDVTQQGTQPINQMGPGTGPHNIASTTPYVNLEGSENGWQSSEDGGVWSCTGCVGSPGGGVTQNAVRVLQKVADQVTDSGESWTTGKIEDALTNASHTSVEKDAIQIALAQAQSNSPSTKSPATGVKSDFFNLPRGVALFNAKKPIVVGTQEGNVHIDKGSLAFVVETGHDVAVYNLHDKHSGGLNVVVGNRLVTIPPGKQLVLTRKPGANFKEVNPGARIAYRNSKEMKLTEDVTGFISDFSIPSAIANIPPLKKMLTSNIPEERRVAQQLLKNSVILADIFGSLGPYQSGR